MLADGTTIKLRVVNPKAGHVMVGAIVSPEIVEESAMAGNFAAIAITIGHTLFSVAARDYPDEMKEIMEKLSEMTGLSFEEASEVEIAPPTKPQPKIHLA